MKKIVIMPGGFHPFHAGHMALYNAARDAFPSADVFVAATDDTSGRPFPFKTKKFLAQQAGIPGNRFIRVKSPFKAEEITQMYDPDDTVLIFVRSEKDSGSQPRPGGVKRDGSAAYLQPYKRNKLEPFRQHGYMAYLPTVQFGPGMTSATEIRAKWPEMESEQKISLIQNLYPSTAGKEQAAGKIVSIFDEIIGSEAIQEVGSVPPPPPPSRQRTKSPGTYRPLNMEGYNTSYLEKIVATNRPQQGITPAQALAELRSRMNDANPDHQPSPEFAQKYLQPRVREATIVNDPDAGLQIIPSGGMGTWDEKSLVSNLARKFASMVDMVKNRNYKGLHHVLYRAGVVENMVRALAELEGFQQKQGRRSIAKGREIDTSDYLDEKSLQENVSSGNPRIERILSMLRSKYPQAQNDLEALILDFRGQQFQDRSDIQRLDIENDQEEAAIDDLESDLAKLKRRQEKRQ